MKRLVQCLALVNTQYSIYVSSHVGHKCMEGVFCVYPALTAPSTMPGAKQVFNDYFLNGEFSINTPSLQMRKLRFPEFHWFTPLLFTP